MESAVAGQALTTATADRRARLGERRTIENSNGTTSVYRYGVAGGTIAQYTYCQLNGDTPFEAVVGLGAHENIQGYGVAMSAMTAGQYGWFLEEGELVGPSLTATAWEMLLANVTTGVLSAAGNQTDADKVVGMVTVDDRIVVVVPGAIGFPSDA